MNRPRLVEKRVLRATFETLGRKRPNEGPNKGVGSRIHILHGVS